MLKDICNYRKKSSAITNLFLRQPTAILLFLFCYSSSSVAADIRILGDYVVEINGQILPSDVPKVQSLPKKITTFVLSSEGGEVSSAMEIGRHIRERKGSVYIRQGQNCFSSCSLLYIAGVNRINNGVLGLHRPYLIGSPSISKEIKETVPNMISNLKKYIDEMGVTKRFSELMLNTPPESMYKLYGEQAKQIIPEVDAIHDEMEVSISARQYGITTEEFRKRSKFADENCAYGSTRAMIECMEAAKWGLSRSLYTKRIQVTEKCKISDKEIEVLKEFAEQGGEWREHPVAIKNYECKISIMAGDY